VFFTTVNILDSLKVTLTRCRMFLERLTSDSNIDPYGMDM